MSAFHDDLTARLDAVAASLRELGADVPADFSGGSTADPAPQPAEAALSEIAQLNADGAFMAAYRRGDRDAVAQMQALFSRAYPEPTESEQGAA
jgi:hypothetical protein